MIGVLASLAGWGWGVGCWREGRLPGGGSREVGNDNFNTGTAKGEKGRGGREARREVEWREGSGAASMPLPMSV